MALLGYLDSIGGKSTIEKVHKIFYDKIYAHPWIGQYFSEIDQKHIEAQQTDFMVDAFGGPKNYFGRFPIPAHKHIFVTEELFDLRTRLLVESLDEVGLSKENQAIWLKIDEAFKKGIVKRFLSECEKRYFNEEIKDFENPGNKKAA